MNSIELTFENPWLLLALIPCVAIILFPFLLMPATRRKTAKRVVPLVLHLVVVILLVGVIAGFRIVKYTDDQTVILLLDLSHSTETVRQKMQGHAGTLLNTIDPEIPVGVVAFGGDQLYSLDLDAPQRTLQLPNVKMDASDLESAMEYAASLAPGDKALRLILLTDGKQTDGDADSAAYKLASRGIRIDAVYYDTTDLKTAEMQIAAFSGPEGAYKGKEAKFVAEVKSNFVGAAKLTLYDGKSVVWQKDCDIQTGSNLFEIAVFCENTGMHTYHLVLETEKDTVVKNNEACLCLSVAGEPSVLVIANTLQNALRIEQFLLPTNDVDCVEVDRVPTSLTELGKYDGVVLANVQYHELPYGYDRILESYVADYGRGLFVAGGRESFLYGNMDDNRLEMILPVDLVLEENTEGKSVALVLVLDCSSSMKGEKIEIAKQGAIKCMEAMTENDLVGVVSFDRHANLTSALLTADDDNKDIVSRAISELKVGSGTFYGEALQMASDELRKSSADIKHILFLSDGQPSDNGYYEIVQSANADGITISTIGLDFSSGSLEMIATYGKGRYYPVMSEKELPNIMLSETEKARVNPLIVGNISPIIEKQSELTDFLGTTKLPSLGGYLGTTLKPKATAYITSDSGHPLFASWHYGFGRVACFTSDLHGDWSSSWWDNTAGTMLVQNMMASILDSVHRTSMLQIEVTNGGQKAHISVTTAEKDGKNAVSLTLKQGEEQKTYQLWQAYPGMFEAELDVQGGMTYQISVVETRQNDMVIDSFEGQIAIPYSSEYDMFAPDGKALLASICGHCQGELFTDLTALSFVQMPKLRSVYDPVVPIAILSALLLLADIAVRKLRWKDVEVLALKIKYLFTRKS